MALLELDNLKELTLADGIRAKVVTGESMTVTHVILDQDAVLPEHAHPQEQIVNVMEGELELTVQGQPHLLTRGKVYTLAPNVPHSAVARTDVYVIDVFCPIREDLRKAAESE